MESPVVFSSILTAIQFFILDKLQLDLPKTVSPVHHNNACNAAFAQPQREFAMHILPPVVVIGKGHV